jgi:hypothetical protein
MRPVSSFGEFVALNYQLYRGVDWKRADVSSPLRAIMAKWLFHFVNHFFDLAKAGGSGFQALFELFNLSF